MVASGIHLRQSETPPNWLYMVVLRILCMRAIQITLGVSRRDHRRVGVLGATTSCILAGDQTLYFADIEISLRCNIPSAGLFGCGVQHTQRKRQVVYVKTLYT